MIPSLLRSNLYHSLLKPNFLTPSSKNSLIHIAASLSRPFSSIPSHPAYPWNQFPKVIRQLETKTLTCPQKVQESLKEELERAKVQQEHLKNSKTQSVFLKILNHLFGESKKMTPVQIKECPEGESVIVAAKGRKSSMEDAHLVDRFLFRAGKEKKTAVVTAVFDGHGGDECAFFAGEKLTEYLIKHIEANNQTGLSDLGMWNALTLALVDLSQNFNPSRYPEGKFNWEAGTTANIALKIDQTVWIANVGDSRAAVVKKNGSVQHLSEDAKAGLLRYKLRVDERLGTVVYSLYDVPRINGQLAVGGALGDHNLNGSVSARPAITKLDLTDPDLKGAILAQASDGLWDSLSSEDAAALYTRLNQQGKCKRVIAETLVQSAYQKGSIDNITLLITSL